MEIKELQKQVHENAKEHGWWDGEERNFGELIALCHSELFEALELWYKAFVLKQDISEFITNE